MRLCSAKALCYITANKNLTTSQSQVLKTTRKQSLSARIRVGAKVGCALPAFMHTFMPERSESIQRDSRNSRRLQVRGSLIRAHGMVETSCTAAMQQGMKRSAKKA